MTYPLSRALSSSPLLFTRVFSRVSGVTTGTLFSAAISGLTTVGSVLTCTTDGTSANFQWTRDGVNISGAVASTYTTVAADDGTSVRCVVTANEGVENSNVLAITYAPAVNTAAPVVTGTTALGDVLSVTNGSWTGSDLSYTRQWLRDGVDISGATASAYMLVEADENTDITCEVTATNSGGSVTQVSNSITVPLWSGAGSISVSSGTYDKGLDGAAPTFVISGVSTSGLTGGTYQLHVATRDAADGVLSTNDIKNGTGNAIDRFTFGPEANILDLTNLLMDLNTSLTLGAIDFYFEHSGGTVSSVVSETGVTYVAEKPVYASSLVETPTETSLGVTFNANVFGSSAPSEWTVNVAGSPVVVSAVSVSGTDVTLTIPAVASGEAVTVAYTGSTLVGEDAEQVATFTAQAATNNVGSSFAPADDTSARHHWDASDTGTITGTNPVTLVGDKIGSSDMTSDTSFVSGSATVNSLNALESTDANSGFLFNASMTLYDDMAIHMVYEIDAVNDNRQGILRIADSDFSDNTAIEANNSSQFDGEIYSDILTNTTFTGGPFSGVVVVSVVADSTAGNVLIYINDTLVATASGYSGANGFGDRDLLYLSGAQGGPFGRLRGKFCEAVLTEDITNRADYTSYLTDKWIA